MHLELTLYLHDLAGLVILEADLSEIALELLLWVCAWQQRE